MFANSPLCFEIDEWEKNWGPQVAEIGAGTGIFSVDQAIRTGKKVVAIDVKADRLQRGAQLATARRMSDVRFLRSRADQLGETLQPHSLDSIWVTFPDPFPKNRAAKHRLTHPRFLRTYASLLTTDGSLLFKTDAKDLFEWSLEQMVDEGWLIRERTFDLHDSQLSEEYKIKTTYEHRFHDEGLPICFLRASSPN